MRQANSQAREETSTYRRRRSLINAEPLSSLLNTPLSRTFSLKSPSAISLDSSTVKLGFCGNQIKRLLLLSRHSISKTFQPREILSTTTATMPRASKRKSSAPPSPSPVKSSSDSRPGKAKTKGVERIDNLFDKYANAGIIDPDGIMSLCKDLEMEHTDIRILMLAWKLNAAKLGYFTQEEWQKGLKTLQVDSLIKLKKAVSELEKEVREPSKFGDFHSFAFRYHLTEDKQKCIDIETICELLILVLGSQFCCQVDLLIDYLKVQSDYKVINLDQWVNFLRFCNEISFPDLENYDENQAWPLILDNFVEWLREKQR